MGSIRLKRYDNRLRKEQSVTLLGGVDEAGRGALAGPVVAAVVVLGPEARLPEVNDSKQLTREAREQMVPEIVAQARGFALGLATAEEVDQINVLQATLVAVRRALDALSIAPEYMVTDFLKIKDAPCPYLAIPEADGTSQAVAAASVLAKVVRDRIMCLLDGEYPHYGFPQHKGYGTPKHWDALNQHGPSTIHRLTYNGVCWFNSEPNIRSRSAEQLALPLQRPLHDFASLLAEEFQGLSPLPFLPEMEFLWMSQQRRERGCE